jgi:arylsulfatase A-like enzyme
MMDSPAKRAFAFMAEEKPELIKTYDVGHRFGLGCLLARRLVEAGARFVEVEYQYAPFKGFDTHENGCTRLADMKKQIDRPIAQLVRDLHERGMLDRTLVVVATEFGRTIANQPSAGVEPDGFAETATGQTLRIESESMYGFHGHFSSCNCMLFFGGGFKEGFVYGKTAPEHPMLAVEKPVQLIDTHATIYKALGIPPETNFITEGRPFYLTKDGKGVAIDAMLT